MIQGQIPVPPEIPSPPFDPNLIFLNDGGPPAIVMIVFLALLATTVILWPVMRALARRLDGKGAASAALQAEVEQLHQRLAEVDVLHQRVAELEERIDFTERMLARAQTPAALPGDAAR
jgi:Tfp pilus assembly protein PilO